MSRHDYAVLTLRGFAIYAWFSALQYFSSAFLVFFQFFHYPSQFGVNPLGFFIPGAVDILAGLFLFMRSTELAAWLMPLTDEAFGEKLPPHPLPAASVAFAVAGVAIFLHALPSVLTPLISLMEQKQIATQSVVSYNEIPRIIAGAFQMVLGFVLFLNSRTFATTWWHKQQPKPAE